MKTNSWSKRVGWMALYTAIGAFCIGAHVLILSAFVSPNGDTKAEAAMNVFTANFRSDAPTER